ncbi:MAG: hypothetical protein KC713_06975 [Candidatus Omnitrophica bacterium]|nr:hypothetical protein [Candidatus Omnitrophota bacterium]
MKRLFVIVLFLSLGFQMISSGQALAAKKRASADVETDKTSVLRVPKDFETIAFAMAEAKRGDTILVSPGRYNENIVMKDGVSLISEEYGRAIIGSTDAPYDEPIIRGDDSIVVQGFYFDGRNDKGVMSRETGILFHWDYKPRYKNAEISNNIFETKKSGIYIWTQCLDFTIKNNTFGSRNDSLYAGPLYGILSEEDSYFDHSRILDNYFKTIHGMYLDGGMQYSTYKGNIFIGLKNKKVGGLVFENKSETYGNVLANNLFILDGVTLGTAVQDYDGENSYINNTIYLNGKMSGNKGLSYRNDSTITRNNIIVSTQPDRDYAIYADYPINNVLSYNLIQGKIRYKNGFPDCEGCIAKDPNFVNPETGDFHLKPGSAAIDAGDPQDDYSLEPFPHGWRINMGAYGNTPEATRSGRPVIQ